MQALEVLSRPELALLVMALGTISGALFVFLVRWIVREMRAFRAELSAWRQDIDQWRMRQEARVSVIEFKVQKIVNATR